MMSKLSILPSLCISCQWQFPSTATANGSDLSQLLLLYFLLSLSVAGPFLLLKDSSWKFYFPRSRNQFPSVPSLGVLSIRNLMPTWGLLLCEQSGLFLCGSSLEFCCTLSVCVLHSSCGAFGRVSNVKIHVFYQIRIFAFYYFCTHFLPSLHCSWLCSWLCLCVLYLLQCGLLSTFSCRESVLPVFKLFSG